MLSCFLYSVIYCYSDKIRIMTDLEKFIETYKQFGIEVKHYKDKDKIRIDLNGWDENSTTSDKFDGYSGFFSDLEFTLYGKFIRQGFWE